MTSMLTDTDLTIIEGLDFEPGCEWEGCSQSADAHVSESIDPCGCSDQAFLCQPHIDELVAYNAEVAAWECTRCGAILGYGKGSTFIHYDIEPLR